MSQPAGERRTTWDRLRPQLLTNGRGSSRAASRPRDSGQPGMLGRSAAAQAGDGLHAYEAGRTRGGLESVSGVKRRLGAGLGQGGAAAACSACPCMRSLAVSLWDCCVGRGNGGGGTPR